MDKPRILLLTTPRSYRATSFMEAARQLEIEVVQGVDMPPELAESKDHLLALDFTRPDEAAAVIEAYAREQPLNAILAVDDSGTLLAAKASRALGLAYNDVSAAEAARDKLKMRQLLRSAAVPCPAFQQFPLDADIDEVAGKVRYPCVVKPLQLSGSRGVIRADNPAELVDAFRQTAAISRQQSPQSPPLILVEEYVPGEEVAVEGIIYLGELRLLAIFDKPDPLQGPLFEETIYVTPSRQPQAVQDAIAQVTAQAAEALGLRRGPVHAELRLNEDGPWLIEIAGRSIGGLCSQMLQFGAVESLEELILREAVGLPVTSFEREPVARGVMMIPIPRAGLLRQVGGLDEAEATPLVERIEITAPLNNQIVPLPAGDSYLGFIFARGNEGDSPASVEAALRRAHEQLHFEIEPVIPLQVRL